VDEVAHGTSAGAVGTVLDREWRQGSDGAAARGVEGVQARQEPLAHGWQLRVIGEIDQRARQSFSLQSMRAVFTGHDRAAEGQ